ncbi:MAG: metallophosphoesterase [Phycisphaerae bacterium]|jgi:3',5'-cyclic AMP phosphodiesterase CpdA
MNDFTRRNFLRSAGILGAWSFFAPLGSAKAAEQQADKTIRLCHLTDIHLTDGRGAPERFAKMLDNIGEQTPKPNLIITGGDSIMDALAENEARVRQEFALLNKLFSKTDIPVYFGLGNHDIWGWNKQNSETDGTEPLWGKKWALKEYGLENSYYHFDRGNWRFVVLDTMQPMAKENGNWDDVYYGALGAEQYKWLEALLGSTPASVNVCVVGHIPFMTVTNFELLKPIDGAFRISNKEVCADGPEVIRLFSRHKNVRLVLSGHMHRVDRIEYMDTTYICDGAASAGWWNGPYHTCHNGYGLIDLHPDGSFEHKYVTTE